MAAKERSKSESNESDDVFRVIDVEGAFDNGIYWHANAAGNVELRITPVGKRKPRVVVEFTDLGRLRTMRRFLETVVDLAELVRQKNRRGEP